MGMAKTFYEPQVAQVPGGFEMTLTISASAHARYWTSKPVRLSASTWEEAHAEAHAQVLALVSAMSGQA